MGPSSVGGSGNIRTKKAACQKNGDNLKRHCHGVVEGQLNHAALDNGIDVLQRELEQRSQKLVHFEMKRRHRNQTFRGVRSNKRKVPLRQENSLMLGLIFLLSSGVDCLDCPYLRSAMTLDLESG